MSLNLFAAARRGAATFLLVLLLFAGAALAHPISAYLEDQAGLEHAVKLAQALDAGKEDLQNPAFRELLTKDPVLSKRAFVAMLKAALELESSDEEMATASAVMAAVLADLIGKEFQDPEPMEIMKGIAADDDSVVNRLIAYHNSLATSTANVSEYETLTKASAYPPQLFEALRPLLVKLIRVQLAIAVASPDLIIAELDSYPQVEAEANKSVTKLGADPNSINLAGALKAHRLVVLAEVGLLDEFEKGAQDVLKEQDDKLQSSATMLTGFRAAYRQRNVAKAESYWRQARAFANEAGSASDPVLEYALLTANFQLRLLKGYSPIEKELLAEALSAWKALDGYRPLMIVSHEDKWFYGRFATRFWMDQLAPYPESAGSFAKAVYQAVMVWTTTLEDSTAVNIIESADDDDILLNPDRVFGVTTFLVALLDQATYVLEGVPVMRDAVGLAGIQQLEEISNSLTELADDVAPAGSVTPGFPAYDLAAGGMVPELRARSRYLISLLEETPKERKLVLLDESLELARQTNNPEVTIDYLIKGGVELARLGQPDKALAAWKEALGIADSLTFVGRSMQASALLAREFGRRGDWSNASLYAERATETIALSAPLLNTNSPDGKELALRSKEMTELSVIAAVESDDPEKALAALTRSQQVQAAAVQMQGQKEAQAEAREVLAKEEQVVVLAQEVQKLQTMPASATRDDLLESTQGLLASTRSEFMVASRELRQKYSELYTRVLRYDPLNLPEIQKSLSADLAVLQYFPTDDALYIFLVTRENFRLRRIPMTAQALETSVLAYVRAVRRPGGGEAAMKAEGAKLYGALIAPVKADIASSKTVVLIPSGRLNSLPFAALSDGKAAPLGAEKEILELAKSTDLVRVAGEGPKPVHSLVAFANATGDLPSAGKEGEEIAQLFGKDEVKLFQGKDATRDAFLKFGSKADALHVATHGEWNIEDSLENYLAMADNQKVSQDQIFELGLEDTSLVILSACNTAMGQGGEVKYVASLAEAFWLAGSRSVVASLWAVNDESTSILMTEFYKALQGGASKAAALRKAQMTVRANPKFAHPYFWSGFVLFGDWR